jgi:hypothetical protein
MDFDGTLAFFVQAGGFFVYESDLLKVDSGGTSSETVTGRIQP